MSKVKRSCISRVVSTVICRKTKRGHFRGTFEQGNDDVTLIKGRKSNPYSTNVEACRAVTTTNSCLRFLCHRTDQLSAEIVKRRFKSPSAQAQEPHADEILIQTVQLPVGTQRQ